MTVLDLRSVEDEVSLDIALSPEDRRHAIHEWRSRMVSEHASARVFAGLLGQMMRAGIDPDRQAATATMAQDELRHARLCANVVRALGGEPVGELPDLSDVPVHRGVSAMEALLRNVVSISCMEETVAVALLEAGRARVCPPLRPIVERILADEVQHARAGWTLLDDVAPTLDDAARRRLGVYLVPAFRHLFARYGASGHARSSPAALAAGACDGEGDLQLFFRTVDDVIIPGLEARGLPAIAALERLAA